MKSNTILLLAVAFAVGTVTAEDKEKKVNLDKLPSPAAEAIKKLSGGEKLEGLSEETEDGKTVYEAKFKKGGHVREVSVDAQGNQVSDEETIEASAAPKAVREAIEKDAAGAKIEKMEKVTEKGTVTFEALVSANGKREELVFSPEGKLLKREAKKGAKD